MDRPLHEQYLRYLGNLLHGNMGRSEWTRQLVSLDLKQHLPATIELSVVAMALNVLLGIPLGILSGIRRDSSVDQLTRVAALVGVSVPGFWLGLVGLSLFYARLGWVPEPGRLSASLTPPPLVTGFLLIDSLLAGRLDAALDTLWHVRLPARVLSTQNLGILTRRMRSSMLEVLGEDYVRTARAKGLGERAILLRHAARTALTPLATVIGLNFGCLLSGAVVIEAVFAWPGLGLYAFRSATALDFPAIMGVRMVVATIYIFANLLVDVAHAVIDPRIRVGG